MYKRLFLCLAFSESVTKETEAVEGTQMDTTLEEAPVEAPSSSDQLKADSSVATGWFKLIGIFLIWLSSNIYT